MDKGALGTGYGCRRPEFWLAAWGAGLSTLLGVVKLWETFWRDRLRLTTTHSWTTQPGHDDTITVVNLSPVPAQISHRTLRWEPRFFRFATIIDVTPDERGAIRIDGRSSETLIFDDQDKFDWSWEISWQRKLVLVLHLFAKRAPMRLIVR